MDYKKMYFYLFNKITDISRQLEEIQLAREAMYINMGEDIRLRTDKKSGQFQTDESDISYQAAN